MEHVISRELFYSNIDLVKKYMVQDKRNNVKILEFRTFEEGLSNASFVMCSKIDFNNHFEAFITLLNYKIHFCEEWLLDETTEENTSDILKNFTNPLINQFIFESISANEAKKRIEWIVRDIKKILESKVSRKFNNPLRWGVYLNNIKIDANKNEFEPIASSIISAIGLSLEWNDISIFYETENDFVLFSWSTSA